MKFVVLSSLIGAFAVVDAFTTPQNAIGVSNGAVNRWSTATATRTSLTMARGVPVVNQWRILGSGALVGVVSNHPSIDDGDTITTSPLADPKSATAEGKIVSTKSGSKYKLGKSKFKLKTPAPAKKVAARAKVSAPPKKVATAARPSIPLFGKSTPAAKAPVKKEPVRKAPVVKAPVKKDTPAQVDRSLQEKLKKAKVEYGLSGQTLCDGKYLLSRKNTYRSTSGKSQLFNAYKADSDGLPVGPALTVKVSPNKEAMARESRNYDKITSGLFSGKFVKKLEYVESGDIKGFEGSSAIVIETGARDLRAIFSVRRNTPGLEGRAMRQAAVAIIECIQGIHSSRLVWTDLKTENFITVSDSYGDDGSLDSVKGIDLESCVPVGGPPVDFSPEACPPEFAKAFLAGEGAEFKVEFSYDIWSYGMVLFELSTGRNYFKGMNPQRTLQELKSPTFEPEFSAVKDSALQDLISQCMQVDPKKRPSLPQILLHPYFLTTGIGPLSF